MLREAIILRSLSNNIENILYTYMQEWFLLIQLDENHYEICKVMINAFCPYLHLVMNLKDEANNKVKDTNLQSFSLTSFVQVCCLVYLNEKLFECRHNWCFTWFPFNTDSSIMWLNAKENAEKPNEILQSRRCCLFTTDCVKWAQIYQKWGGKNLKVFIMDWFVLHICLILNLIWRFSNNNTMQP